MQMPFGKYKDRDIEDLPSGYLLWLTMNSDNEQVAEESDNELQWRKDHNAHWYGDNE